MKKEIYSSTFIMNLVSEKSIRIVIFAAFFYVMLLFNGCHKKNKDVTPSTEEGYKVVNLVADTAGFGAARIDTNLSNAWGIAIGPTGNFWISSNHTGRAVIYDRNGATQLPPVSIPSNGELNGGAPTGVVFNPCCVFPIPGNGEISKFIFAGEDGHLYAWGSGDTTRTAAIQANTVYKGIALAKDGGSDFLYATDFHNNKIDVYDMNFNLVTGKSFLDPYIPAGFAPFNIQKIEDKLYVTYAKQLGPDNMDDEAGPGNGFVNIFNTDGTLERRFASNGTLNSPWGIALAPPGFGKFKNAILIGNFGNGHINAFDSYGNFLGQLDDNGNPIVIDGLWALVFPLNNLPGDPNQLFFSAGPDDENHGLFGYIKTR
jgi:uncharacterized protein (TIGR03118 family)